MQTDIELLLLAAVAIACLHTLTGPDHYLPFVALSKARGWSFPRTLMWTVLCGCGHVWSSVLLGLGGAMVGWSVSKVAWLENIRGGFAGWALLLFGLTYAVWGIFKAGKNSPHKHFDVQEDKIYVYEHQHGQSVAPHERHVVTPWVMFLIFVLGPCEPMIPLLYFPAAKSSWFSMWLLVLIYTLITLLTMLLMVTAGYFGLRLLNTNRLERYMHLLGGITILISGAGIVILGW